MRAMLHLRPGVTPARFLVGLGKEIRAGDHRTWEVAKARPLTIRHRSRFKGSVSLRPAPKRRAGTGDHRPPDVVVSLTGKDAGMVLRFFTYLVAIKLKDRVEGLYIQVPEE